MKSKQKLLKALADGMDLPTLPGLPVAEIWGTGRVVVENHEGILAYNRKEILVKTAYGQMKIIGQKLELTSMTDAQLIITGKIEGVHLEGRELN